MIGNRTEREAWVVVDLSHGDTCKGSITDYLARTRRVSAVVRFHGGGQAGHNVVTADGRHHTFSHFGSGSFLPQVETHLSRHMIIGPPAMLAEAERLREIGVADILARTTMSGDALIVTPYQRAANRLREIVRGDGRHGSCGMGIGETVWDSLRLDDDAVFVRDLLDPIRLRRKLRRLRDFKLRDLADVIAACRNSVAAREEIHVLESPTVTRRFITLAGTLVKRARVVNDGERLRELFSRPNNLIFEGAQGVLLDEHRGFHPYTTWSTCTTANAEKLIEENGYDGRTIKLGLIRAYSTRHGPGPFVTEDAALTAALPDRHNVKDDWQRHFRVGWLDLMTTRYAAAACGGLDALAVSCLDRLRDRPEWLVGNAYDLPLEATGARDRLVADEGRPGRFTDLRLGQLTDRRHQEELTQLLFQARPVYEISASDPDFDQRCRQHLARIAESLTTPVLIASYGPTAEDKRSLA